MHGLWCAWLTLWALASPRALADTVTLAVDSMQRRAQPTTTTTTSSECKCDGELKVASYNVYLGLRTDQPDFPRLRAWLQSGGDFDVVALLDELARSFGFPHHHFSAPTPAATPRGSRLHILVLSRTPITLVAQYHRPLFHHALVHVEVQGVTFLVTHANPHAARKRRVEMEFIARVLQERRGAPTVVMGDLNTLSPLDEATHNHAALATGFLAHPTHAAKLHKKFLLGDTRAVDYGPMQVLLDQGLVDPNAGLPVDTSATVPTSLVEDPNHAASMRLDYVLVNPAFRERFPRHWVRTARDPALADLSDHFPVCLCAGTAEGSGDT